MDKDGNPDQRGFYIKEYCHICGKQLLMRDLPTDFFSKKTGKREFSPKHICSKWRKDWDGDEHENHIPGGIGCELQI